MSGWLRFGKKRRLFPIILILLNRLLQNMRAKQLPKKLVFDEEKRFSHYEKLYFHELELREKLHARVGFPLTIVLSRMNNRQ